MNEYYTIKIELDLEGLRERIISATMKHVGGIVLETNPVWTIDCRPKDVSEAIEAAEAIFDLNIGLNVTDMDEVTVLREAHVFADVFHNVTSIKINRTDVTSMFVGLEIAMRMTAESRAHFADRIRYCCAFRTDQIVRSMDTPDGTIFYIWDKKTNRPMRDINVDGIWDEFLSELENVYDLDSEDRPMMKYVVMNCQSEPKITKVSL